MENSQNMQSQDIKELVSALSKAQGVMRPAVFNRVNPHFKTRYADFTSCMDCCREPLATNGLSIMQYCETVSDKLMLVTMLAHVSGQWIKSYFPLNPAQMTSQAVGAAMTYGKRYSLSALLGIVSDDEDDDGESEQGRGNGAAVAKTQNKVNPVQEQKTPPKPRIDKDQLLTLKALDEALDDECKSKIYSWLANSHKIRSLEEVTVDIYKIVVATIENALKFMEQNKKEVAHV